jgi:cytochrome c peroxidase
VNRSALVGVTIALAGCPHRADHKTPRKDAGAVVVANDDAAPTAVVLPPAPPVPQQPAGLPALPSSAGLDAVTPDQLALGELLFWDGRLATDGKTACATCHDPAHGYSGSVAIDKTAAGEPNRRHAPTLVNLAWAREYGWDGRFTSLGELMAAHVKGQLGQDLDTAMTKLAAMPVYAAHLARVGGTPGDAALHALEAFALTRYDGDSPWDRLEPSARTPKPGSSDPIVAGYLVFTGKGQCAVCHTPPLYTDFGYHVVDARPPVDDGRGKVDPNQRGAMRTPTLRGAEARSAFFHDGRFATLDQAIDAHLPANFGSDADPTLRRIALTVDERAHVLAFVRALTADRPPSTKPVLP